MRRIAPLAAIAVLAAAAAVAQEPPPGRPSPATVEPSGEAKILIGKIKGWASWPVFPETATPLPSKQHGGVFVVIHHNAEVGRAMKEHKLPLPDGSMIVKENRPSAGAKPEVLTTMWKQNGAWFYLKSTPDGRVFTEQEQPLAGRVRSCDICHGGQSDNDNIFSHNFRR
jgi:hypothetical protein